MATLVDFEIIQRQEQDEIITPFSTANVEPASYDLTLGGEYYRSVNTSLEPGSIDLATGETQGVKGQHAINPHYPCPHDPKRAQRQQRLRKLGR